MLIYCLNSSVLPLGMTMLVTPRLVPTLGMMMLVVTPRLAPPDRYIPCGRRDAHRANGMFWIRKLRSMKSEGKTAAASEAAKRLHHILASTYMYVGLRTRASRRVFVSCAINTKTFIAGGPLTSHIPSYPHKNFLANGGFRWRTILRPFQRVLPPPLAS